MEDWIINTFDLQQTRIKNYDITWLSGSDITLDNTWNSWNHWMIQGDEPDAPGVALFLGRTNIERYRCLILDKKCSASSIIQNYSSNTLTNCTANILEGFVMHELDFSCIAAFYPLVMRCTCYLRIDFPYYNSFGQVNQ